MAARQNWKGVAFFLLFVFASYAHAFECSLSSYSPIADECDRLNDLAVYFGEDYVKNALMNPASQTTTTTTTTNDLVNIGIGYFWPFLSLDDTSLVDVVNVRAIVEIF